MSLLRSHIAAHSGNFDGERSQRREAVEEETDPLADIRLVWVDDRRHDRFTRHRSFTRYVCDLEMIRAVMSQYSKSVEKVDVAILNATLDYGLKAHDIYADALLEWLVDNLHSFAKPKVEDLVVNYPDEERENLKRYYDRAMKDPDEHTTATVTSILPTASQLKSTLSHHFCQIIEDQQKKIVELRRKTEEMKLALEEEDLDIIEQQKRKEFETKRNE